MVLSSIPARRLALTGRPRATGLSPSAFLACCRKTTLSSRRSVPHDNRGRGAVDGRVIWREDALRAFARPCRKSEPLLRLAVLVVLREERPQIVDFLLVLDPGEGHLGAGNLCLGILDVVLEFGLAPGDAGILVGVGVGITVGGAGLAAVKAVQLRTD